MALGIVSFLGLLGLKWYESASQKARMVRELAAARTLMAAFQLYAAEHNGQLLAGYDRSVHQVTRPDGSRIVGEPVYRYPFRIAPYLNWKFEGSIYVNRNGEQVAKSSNGVAYLRDYLTSMFPAFGMNHYFVGGHVNEHGEVDFGDHVVTRLGQTTASLLVFASGGTGDIPGGFDGYSHLTPPRLTQVNWSAQEWSSQSLPGAYGNVDARYNGRAIAAFLDGSVKALTIEELRDMRLWCREAAAVNDPDYLIPH
jgi:hypothetical protein